MRQFDGGIIRVDDDFARFGSKSYAINKINTVEVREKKPYGQGLFVVFSLLAMIFGLTLFSDFSVGTFSATLVFIAIAIFAWKRSQIIEYQLFLMTSSSEAQAYVSRDENQVFGLRNAIEHAMIKKPTAS